MPVNEFLNFNCDVQSSSRYLNCAVFYLNWHNTFAIHVPNLISA